MTGELFEISDNILRVVALDGHRISIRNVELKKSYESRKVIIPGNTLSDISKILSGDMDKTVSIYFTDRHALFEFDDTIVVSRLIEGDYFKLIRCCPEIIRHIFVLTDRSSSPVSTEQPFL